MGALELELWGYELPACFLCSSPLRLELQVGCMTTCVSWALGFSTQAPMLSRHVLYPRSDLSSLSQLPHRTTVLVKKLPVYRTIT